MVILLIELNANVDAADIKGRTPAHEVATYGE
jgi:hypothetical protein